MKLMYNGRHLKTIPKEFAEIPEIEHYIEDEFNLRLDEKERKHLSQALFEHRTRKFVTRQRQNPLLDAYLGDAKIVDAVKVITTHENYYAIRFDGEKLLKCPYEVYLVAPFHGIIQKA